MDTVWKLIELDDYDAEVSAAVSRGFSAPQLREGFSDGWKVWISITAPPDRAFDLVFLHCRYAEPDN